ncbi:MAG: type II toxin-antitoxin system VapC family toxin [Methylocystis sp.]|nr:type II toxin-antitoxin system VapC family toxin [Methylocystis sp.]MBI3275111.1 type II toxin-antitoxin system VapC family toxin [Methylocystis sp.]
MPNAALFDTNVISELSRKRPDARVVAFVEATPRVLVSVVLFHELSYGFEAANHEQKLRLSAFLAAIRDRFGPRAIPVDLGIAETAGRLRAYARVGGRVLTVGDSLIAATALAKGVPLVTRNGKDFEGLDVPLIDPFSR